MLFLSLAACGRDPRSLNESTEDLLASLFEPVAESIKSTDPRCFQQINQSFCTKKKYFTPDDYPAACNYEGSPAPSEGKLSFLRSLGGCENDELLVGESLTKESEDLRIVSNQNELVAYSRTFDNAQISDFSKTAHQGGWTLTQLTGQRYLNINGVHRKLYLDGELNFWHTVYTKDALVLTPNAKGQYIRDGQIFLSRNQAAQSLSLLVKDLQFKAGCGYPISGTAAFVNPDRSLSAMQFQEPCGTVLTDTDTLHLQTSDISHYFGLKL